MRFVRHIGVFVVAAAIAWAFYALVVSRPGQRSLATIQEDLTRRKILLPISEIAPPASAEALERGGQFIALTEEVASLNKTSPSITQLVTMRFTAPGTAVPTVREAAPVFSDSKGKHPQSWLELRSELEASRPQLTRARQMLAQPIALPYDHTSTKGGSFGQISHLAAWLKAAAVLSLKEGNLSEAIDLLASIQQVAAMVGQPKSAICVVLDLGIWSFACRDLFWDILQDPSLTEDELVQLNAIALQGDFFQDIIRSQEMHLASAPYLYAELLKTMAGKKSTLSALDSPSGVLGSETALQIRDAAWPLLWANADLAQTLELEGMRVEKLRASVPAKNWADFTKANPEVSSTVVDYDLWRFPVAGSLADVFLGKSIARTAFRAETARQLILTTIALRRYHLVHGNYPDSLDKLVPGYLSALPQDYYSTETLKYRPLDGGTYLLYSIGEDGTDDGGDASSSGMTSGRDIVWPLADTK